MLHQPEIAARDAAGQNVVSQSSAKSLCARRILVCLPGERPHLVTRALYGLAARNRSWIPDEIVVITTTRGAHELRARLVRQPRFRELCQRIGVSSPEGIDLTIDAIDGGGGGGALVPHGTRAARCQETSSHILSRVQAITDEPNTELYVCLGEDSSAFSGFVLGQVMLMLGRPQDKLIEVGLNGPPRHTDFFYPLCAAEPQIEIRDLSYMRMERLASVRPLVRQSDYPTLCRGLDGQTHLRVSSEFRGLNFRFSNAFDIRCDSSHRVAEPRFEPRAAALYALYAQRARQNQPYVTDEQILDEPAEFLALYEACLLGGEVKSQINLSATRLTRAALRSARSRIGSTLSSFLRSGSSYSDYRIYRRPNRCDYGLRLSPDQIAIDGTCGYLSLGG